MAILELMRSPRRDRAWLEAALQAAVELEFFTIPPYLTALWSIKEDQTHEAARTIREVVYEEMQHMALACNMLAGIGGVPRINCASAVPVYPRPLPGGVRPELTVGLSGLTEETIETFMKVEEPEHPIEFKEGFEALGEAFPTIGSFYEAIRVTFHDLEPEISVDRQVAGPLAPVVVKDLSGVDAAIRLIRVQGEGTDVSPVDESPADLAHYYRFKELKKGRRLVYSESKKDFRWGPKLPFPETYPVALVPAGGYREADVAPEVAAGLREFDQTYSRMLDELQSAWGRGGQGALLRAIELMFSLRGPARALMQTNIPGISFTYCPCFRYLPT